MGRSLDVGGSFRDARREPPETMKNLFTLLTVALFITTLQAAEQRPNVVILYADDMGVADISSA